MYVQVIIFSVIICAILLRFPAIGVVLLCGLILINWTMPAVPPPELEPLEASAADPNMPLLYNNQPPCALNDGLEDAEPTKPLPASSVSMAVLEDAALPPPGQVDRLCESQWFPKNQRRNLKEQQRDDFALQRSMRRDHEWGDTRTWSAEDKARYERARSRMEKEIASALKPDPYTITEVDPDRDYTFSTDQPFPSVTSDSQVFHTAHFRVKSGNTGDFAGLLRTVI